MRKKDHVQTIMKKVAKLGPAIPGTIRKVRLRCGKDGCRCQSGKDEDKHGPYYFWSRKVKGRMTSSSIPRGKVGQFRRWIENRRRLERLVDQILAQGQKDALKILED